eukprot:gene15425-biopygen4967
MRPPKPSAAICGAGNRLARPPRCDRSREALPGEGGPTLGCGRGAAARPRQAAGRGRLRRGRSLCRLALEPAPEDPRVNGRRPGALRRNHVPLLRRFLARAPGRRDVWPADAADCRLPSPRREAPLRRRQLDVPARLPRPVGHEPLFCV